MMCQSVSVTTTNKLYSIELKCLAAFNVYISKVVTTMTARTRKADHDQNFQYKQKGRNIKVYSQ